MPLVIAWEKPFREEHAENRDGSMSDFKSSGSHCTFRELHMRPLNLGQHISNSVRHADRFGSDGCNGTSKHGLGILGKFAIPSDQEHSIIVRDAAAKLGLPNVTGSQWT